MRDDMESYADQSGAATKPPAIRAEIPGPTRRFFRCTAMIMTALLMPAGVQALFNIAPDLVQPDNATMIMAFSLSAAIVATAVLIAALVRGAPRFK